ncbi:MAG TPA: RtcB family protein, partial [Methylomirabilota bacterium]|nr:RtcB family protein [Methylomirabilota bacterium]
DEIEAETLQQVRDIGSLDLAVRVAVMPDAHKGYGMPIGCMLATNGAVVPYAVGVDIGCGMVAARTTLGATDVTPERVREALGGIYRRVPVGQPTRTDPKQGTFETRQDSVAIRQWWNDGGQDDPVLRGTRERADRQVGTLGGGNHFVELQLDVEGALWLMLHTGSRSFGKAVCDRWHAEAVARCANDGIALPNRELAYLDVRSEAGTSYLRDMSYAMRFAEESRARIYERSVEALRETFGGFDVTQTIETHHNFAAVESHDGQDLLVHRKGAVRTTDATGAGALVTIPGSMQTGSYIGRGKPNAIALDTCSHGAGRKLGRNAVRKANVGVDIQAEMSAQGICLICPEGADTLDESGRAYKDIEDVMTRQRDLVDPVVKLRPLGVVKG